MFIRCPRQLLYIIICCFLCQQLFPTFFDSFSLFQRRPLKLIFSVDLLLPCSATLDTIHPGVDKSQHHFSKYFQNGTLTDFTIFTHCFCAHCTSFSFIFNTAFRSLPYSQKTDDYIVFRGRRTTKPLPPRNKRIFYFVFVGV